MKNGIRLVFIKKKANFISDLFLRVIDKLLSLLLLGRKEVKKLKMKISKLLLKYKLITFDIYLKRSWHLA